MPVSHLSPAWQVPTCTLPFGACVVSLTLSVLSVLSLRTSRHSLLRLLSFLILIRRLKLPPDSTCVHTETVVSNRLRPHKHRLTRPLRHSLVSKNEPQRSFLPVSRRRFAFRWGRSHHHRQASVLALHTRCSDQCQIAEARLVLLPYNLHNVRPRHSEPGRTAPKCTDDSLFADKTTCRCSSLSSSQLQGSSFRRVEPMHV